MSLFNDAIDNVRLTERVYEYRNVRYTLKSARNLVASGNRKVYAKSGVLLLMALDELYAAELRRSKVPSKHHLKATREHVKAYMNRFAYDAKQVETPETVKFWVGLIDAIWTQL